MCVYTVSTAISTSAHNDCNTAVKYVAPGLTEMRRMDSAEVG